MPLIDPQLTFPLIVIVIGLVLVVLIAWLLLAELRRERRAFEEERERLLRLTETDPHDVI